MKDQKTINPVWNVIKTEWMHLGSRKKIFVFYCFLFVIAGAISLLSPLVVGLIFNSIQQTIGSEAELRKLIWLIFDSVALDIHH